MTDQLLLDFDAAVELHVTMTAVAEQLDHDRRMLAGPVADAADLIGSRGIDPDPHLRSVAEMLRREADDLARRVRMIAFGGPEINAGLHALDVIAANWDTIDNQGRPSGNDGIVSRSDLEWAVDNLGPAVAASARWLLDHDEFFAAVETANHNTNYLADGGASFASGEDGDGKLSRDDLASYVSKLDTWATLVPDMATIDIAAHGGDLDGVMSKNDFEAFLDDQTLPPQVRAAAQTVLDDSAYHDTGGIGWDDVLMVASFIPIVGDFIDGAMALYYLSQGDWEQAALSGLGLLPIPGLTGGTARGARMAASQISEETAGEFAERIGREGLDVAGSTRRTPASGIGASPRQTYAPANLGQRYGTTEVVDRPDLGITGFRGSANPSEPLHALNRAIERNVSPEAILETVRNPAAVLRQANGRHLYLSEHGAVVLDPAGQMVTTWGRFDFKPTVEKMLHDALGETR